MAEQVGMDRSFISDLWQEGNLYPQPGTTCHGVRHEHLKAHVAPVIILSEPTGTEKACAHLGSEAFPCFRT
jgi:hypothetical protein